jgi:hypothetical protein
LLAATLYQGNPDRNHKLWNINLEIYTPYVGAAGMLLHIKGKLSSLRKLYDRHHALVDRYGISLSQMTTKMFHLSLILPGSFLIHDLSPGFLMIPKG